MSSGREEIGLRGRTALVTGGSRGIGLAVARALADAGASVALVARPSPALDDAARAIGGTPLPCDVTAAAEVLALPERARAALGSAPDIVVNSAGGFALSPLAETAPEEFERQLAVNLRGPFLAIRAFLPGMLARGAGHLLSIGSVAGRKAFVGNGAYSASKFGLRGLHAVLAEEIRGTGVRATLLEPAATDTPLWDPFDPDRRDDLPSRAVMLRAEDVARAVLFALSQPAGVEIPLLSIRSTL